MGTDCHLLLPDRSRAVHFAAGSVVRFQDCSQAPAGYLPGLVAGCYRTGQPVHLDWPGYAQQDAQAVDVLGRLPGYLPRRHGRHVGYGQLAGACHR